MIKVEVFDGAEYPITIIGEGSIEEFFEWSNRSKIVGIVEKDTEALFTIPILKYPVKVTELQDEQEEPYICDNCKNQIEESD